MSLSIVITECLQTDFVGLIGPHDALPNRLHVGNAESLRLLGSQPSSGPVAQFLAWARALPEDELAIVHVRDLHDPNDPRQREHLAHFGDHCLAGSRGASFVPGLGIDSGGRERVVDALTLSDFEHSRLPEVLDSLLDGRDRAEVRVGVIGVWTDAKVSYLLYDLATRVGLSRLATCSALTASVSRHGHFFALDHLRSVLGVTVHDSVGDFAAWLNPRSPLALAPLRVERGPRLSGPPLEPDDQALVQWLFRDSAEVALFPLGGGFSGAVVFRTESTDRLGHAEAPCVLKLGPRDTIAAERTAFERIESVLGNHAPSLRGFVDLGARGGLKYAYAAMGRGGVRTLKSLFETATELPTDATGDALLPGTEKILAVLKEVFDDVLAPLYSAARYERCVLTEAYGFSSRWAHSVAQKVRALDPSADDGHPVVRFYRETLSGPLPRHEQHFVSYVHGDLNGANVLLDDRENVWVIDFFHTGRAHVWKDLAKLENDVLYLFTPLRDEDELAEAGLITTALGAVQDLRAPLGPLPDGVTAPALRRAWAVLSSLRAFGGRVTREDRHPGQLDWALLRYAVHTLGFDEASPLQKRWALHAAAGFVRNIEAALAEERALRVDWLPGEAVGLTLCPGRRDRGRELAADLRALQGAGITHVVSLLTDAELEWAGVPELPDVLRDHFACHRVFVGDQNAPSEAEVHEAVEWVERALAAGGRVVVHCMGGLGRSGLLAAAWLMSSRGCTAEAALETVRAVRGPRAVESAPQEAFVHAWR